MIHVCYGLYDKFGRYAKFTGTSMQSLFDNTKSEVTVHILHDNTLTDDNRIKLQTVAKNFNRQIKFYNVEKLLPEKIIEIKKSVPTVSESNYSIATFYRFLIPSLIAEEKIIYLDSDTIVNLDVNELWKIELGDKIFAVVPENSNGVPVAEHIPLCFEGFVKAEDYFNAGVLLINLNRFRQEEENIKHGMKFIAENPQYTFFDQDILNYCFSRQTVQLPSRFNFYVAYARDYKNFSTENTLCHYVGSAFDFNMRDKFSRLWMDYFLQTPFFNTETLLRIYDCLQALNAEAKEKLIDVSKLFSNRRRIFYAELNNFETFRKIFKVDADEKIIDGTKADSTKLLLNEMKKLRGKAVFILFSRDYESVTEYLTSEGFVNGLDFVNAFHFFSGTHGRPIQTNFLVKAI